MWWSESVLWCSRPGNPFPCAPAALLLILQEWDQLSAPAEPFSRSWFPLCIHNILSMYQLWCILCCILRDKSLPLSGPWWPQWIAPKSPFRFAFLWRTSQYLSGLWAGFGPAKHGEGIQRRREVSGRRGKFLSPLIIHFSLSHLFPHPSETSWKSTFYQSSFLSL